MIRITWTVAIVAAIGAASTSQIALAICQSDYAIAKVAHEGNATHPINGSGAVTVQVQVNADGSHVVQKVIRSTNAADNDAALDIAKDSSYKPAMCGATPQMSFYDFKLKFDGSNVTTANATSLGGSAADEHVESLVYSGKWSPAAQAAQAVLSKSPSDMKAQEMLGVADYYLDNSANPTHLVDAAQAFSKLPSVDPKFQAVAAQSFAAAAVQLAMASTPDVSTATTFANKAMGLSPNANSQFALGVVQLASPSTSSTGIATLQSVRSKLGSDRKTKFVVDDHLLAAYLAANDMANAQAIATEMKQLDPTKADADNLIAGHYLGLARDQVTAKNYAAAVPLFDQAATANSSVIRVTAYTEAAFALVNDQKDTDLPNAQAYAQKALAINPNDPYANFAAGVADTFVWTSSHKEDDKTQATTYLAKADSLAKAASNTALASKIESFQSAQFPSSASK